jgi:hypothetical protein
LCLRLRLGHSRCSPTWDVATVATVATASTTPTPTTGIQLLLLLLLLLLLKFLLQHANVRLLDLLTPRRLVLELVDDRKEHRVLPLRLVNRTPRLQARPE